MTDDDKNFVEKHEANCKKLKRVFTVACVIAMASSLVLGAYLSISYPGHYIADFFAGALLCFFVLFVFAVIYRNVIVSVMTDTFKYNRIIVKEMFEQDDV